LLELNRIYNMDCVEGMKLLPNECIDLTVTSPPYDNLRKYKGFKWDFEGVANELYRVTKKGGIVVWVVGDATINGSETGTSFKQALYFKEIGFRLHDTMIFAKKNPIPLNHNRYEQYFEYMFVFSKGKPKTFNPIMIPCVTAGRRYNWECESRVEEQSVRNRKETAVVKSHKQKGNIWEYTVGGGKGETGNHPAIFPEQLANDHIISWSNEGDLVLDPFMGSGTTAKMALLNNRKFIGFEISEEYCKIAEERISQIQPQRQEMLKEGYPKLQKQLDWLDELLEESEVEEE